MLPLNNELCTLMKKKKKKKNSFNLLVFSLKSEASSPSIRRGGMTGIFLPLKIAFRIEH